MARDQSVACSFAECAEGPTGRPDGLVDGVTRQPAKEVPYTKSSSCGRPAWVEVDLGTEYEVEFVQVHLKTGRSYCAQRVELRTAPTGAPAVFAPPSSADCGTESDAGAAPPKQTCACTHVYARVRVYVCVGTRKRTCLEKELVHTQIRCVH